MTGRTPSEWEKLLERNPGHSQWYVERFRRLAAEGRDIVGEARLVDAMVGRGARILDAGCGGGRVGGHLHGVGHTVVGVDVDPVLIAAAEEDYPGPTWLVGDLAQLDLPARGITDGFDVVVCAGNVMPYTAESTRLEVLRRLGQHLRGEGRLVVGFGRGRGYDVGLFLQHVEAAGLQVDVQLESWDLRPWSEDSEFLVAVLARR